MKKTILLFSALCLLCISQAEAKTLKFPKGTTNVNQLNDELMAKFPAYQGTPQADGTFKNPTLRVESTSTEILVTVPESAPDAAISQAVASHVPSAAWPPEPEARKSAKAKLKALGFTDEEIGYIVR